MTLELRFEIPGQLPRTIPLNQPVMKIGTLLSNEVVIRAPGVDPIHALIEEIDPGKWVLTDLGSATGLKFNGNLLDVETEISPGDQITLGTVTISVMKEAEAAAEATMVASEKNVATAPPPPSGHEHGGAAATLPSPDSPGGGPGEPTVRVATEARAARRQGAASDGEGDDNRRGTDRKDVLFSPRHARPSGDVLECVAYWGDTILDVELFHPKFKGFDKVTIGVPGKAHLIAAGKSHFDAHELAEVRENGYKIRLKRGMQARLRKAGKVEKVKGSGSFSMGRRDIAHIKYGAVRYFMLFVRPPTLRLPRSGPKDPFFLGLMSVAFLIYFMIIPVAYLTNPNADDDDQDDDSPWTVVQVPEKSKPTPKPERKKQPKPPEQKKPPVKIAKKKDVVKVQKKPPPPKPKPFKPAKPREKEKLKQPKPVKKPTQVVKTTNNLRKTAKNTGQRKPKQAKPTQNNRPNLSRVKLPNRGMPSTGAKNPDFKLAGPKLKNTKLGRSGGVKGSGMNQQGAPRKGKGKASYKGVEGVKNNKASGVNLSKLGLGAGKLINKTGAGRINTNFKNSAGGAGGGMGSASKTYGLGGVGSGKSLGLAGAGGSVNNFGSGAGGFLSGQGGRGGAGGAGLGSAFGGGRGGGRGRANVTVPPGDPVVSGGLTQQEIMAVIRANLNQIRHCYEQLLQRSPNAAGKVTVQWTIGTNGRVTTVRVANSSISDTRMRGCVTGRIRRWAFPRLRGGQPVNVTFPFVFNPL